MSSWQATIDDVLNGGKGLEALGRLQDPLELRQELALLGYQFDSPVMTQKGEKGGWFIGQRNDHAERPFFQEEGRRLVPSDSAIAYYFPSLGTEFFGTKLLYLLMTKPGSLSVTCELEGNARAISSGIIEESSVLKTALYVGGAAVGGIIGLGFGKGFDLLLPFYPGIFQGIGAGLGFLGGLLISSSVYSYLRSGAVVKLKNPRDYLYGATAAETIDKEVKSRVLNRVAGEAYEALSVRGVEVSKKQFWDALLMLTQCAIPMETGPDRTPAERLTDSLERIADFSEIGVKTGVPLTPFADAVKPHYDELGRYGLLRGWKQPIALSHPSLL